MLANKNNLHGSQPNLHDPAALMKEISPLDNKIMSKESRKMSYRGQGSDAAAVVITSSRSRNRATKVSNTSVDSSRNGHSGKQQISAF